jgi:2-hydroxychromene-2-carboxylate isomerase
MPSVVELYYDFGSPASYLAYKHLPAVVGKTGASITLKPFLLGGVFKATGNRSPIEVDAKGKWMWRDLDNHARRYGVPFNPNPHFPIGTLHLMRGAYAVPSEDLKRYSDAIFEAIWVEGRDLNQPKLISETLSKAGFDARHIFAAVEQDEVKARLKAVTEDAVARGAFGAPTLFVDDQMFFGQDRLDFVAEACAGQDHNSRTAAA